MKLNISTFHDNNNYLLREKRFEFNNGLLMRHRKYGFVDIFDTSLPNEKNLCSAKIYSSKVIVENEQ